jgi:hypothetical protein
MSFVYAAGGHGVNNKQARLAGAQQHTASSAASPILKDDSPVKAHASKASKAARTAMTARTHSWACKPGWVTHQEAVNSAIQMLFNMLFATSKSMAGNDAEKHSSRIDSSQLSGLGRFCR